jgi:hypothetical protein
MFGGKKASRRELSVFAEIAYDTSNERFVVGYSHMEKRPRNVGTGRSLGSALNDLSGSIGADGSRSRSESRRLYRDAEPVNGSLRVFYDTKHEMYVIELSDRETTVSGDGNNMSTAFADLSEKIR